jgi:tetratricopeptide (TPR) repeat protein
MSYYTDDIKTASETFLRILDKDPENAAALAYMGKLAYEEENYLRATKFIQQAIKQDPSNYDYWLDYGTYLRYQGKFNDAANAWKKAAELDPSYFLAYAYLAGNYDDLGQWDEALENYHKVIETNPKYFYAYESTAILEYRAKNYENAIKYFTKTYEFSSSYAYTLMIAACWFKLNKPQEAKKVLAAQLKKLDSKSTEYELVRFFHDNYNRNAESNLIQKITKESNSNNRGKMLFYMGLYYELNKAEELANEYYAKVTSLKAPMFFEYRIAEWGLQK